MKYTRKLRFLSNLLIILVISLSAAFFVSTKIYNEYWYDMMLEVDELLQDKRLNLVEEIKANKNKSENIFHNLNNQIWLLADNSNVFKSSDVLSNIYYHDDFIGYAVVITNDGWLMTNDNIKNTKNLVLINNKNEIIEITDVVKDELLDISYLKVDKSNLEPIAIADSNMLEISETVYAIKPNLYNYQNEAIVNSIRNLHSRFIAKKQDLIYSPEDIVIYGFLNHSLDENLPIVNEQSQFIGFSRNFEDNSYLLPSKYIRYSITKLFDNKEGIIYPSLNISYIDLSEVVINADMPENGALIYSVLNNKELKKEDIIISVANEQINEIKCLNTLLLDYKVGDKVKLHIIRQNKEMEVDVVLQPLSL